MNLFQFFARSYWRDQPALIATIRHNSEVGMMLENDIADASGISLSQLRRIAKDNDIVLRSRVEPADYLEDAEPMGL